MRTATYQLKDLEDLVFYMGYVGENEHRALRIDCSEAFEEYPNATPALSIAPPRGEPYPGMITEDGNYVLWVITDSDLAYDGSGEAQFSFVKDEKVMKTYRFKTKIDKSIMSSGTRPNPLEDFIVRADAVLEEVEQAVIDVTNKADKVTEATAGNFAGLDENGNLTDSGKKPSDFLTQHQDISGKADKVTGATSGNFAGLDANGNLTDSGKKPSDFLTQHQDISGKADKTDTVLLTTLSRGRKANTEVGEESFAFGYNVEASGETSCAIGSNTVASGDGAVAEGQGTIATHALQHVSGRYNVQDPSTIPGSNVGTYAEIVGCGTSSSRKNARTLDWSGNERLKGTLYVGCNNDSSGGSEVATKVVTENVSGSTPSITGVDNHRYICGTVSEITITPPQTGMIDVVFTAGTSCVLNLANTVTMPEWFDPTDIEDGKRYEINIEDGYGVVMAWN